MPQISHHASWRCPKCGHTTFQTDEFAATGTGVSRFFDVQNKRFTTVSCTNCYFTEIYRVPMNKLSQVLDFFVGG